MSTQIVLSAMSSGSFVGGPSKTHTKLIQYSCSHSDWFRSLAQLLWTLMLMMLRNSRMREKGVDH